MVRVVMWQIFQLPFVFNRWNGPFQRISLHLMRQVLGVDIKSNTTGQKSQEKFGKIHADMDS